MNRFTVVWVKDVLDELAEIWMGSNEREAITLATQEIDNSLSIDPGLKGGELKEGIRFFLAPPLRVLYTISESDRIVEIVLVRSI
jgi:hypothetical protein